MHSTIRSLFTSQNKPRFLLVPSRCIPDVYRSHRALDAHPSCSRFRLVSSNFTLKSNTAVFSSAPRDRSHEFANDEQLASVSSISSCCQRKSRSLGATREPFHHRENRADARSRALIIIRGHVSIQSRHSDAFTHGPLTSRSTVTGSVPRFSL